MPVESIRAENFQKHADRTVEFDLRLTTITGQTDAGKSSLLRLLRWICLNTPDGDGFIRIGSKGAIGTLRIDGHEIRRVRMANSTNEYYLDGEKYVAFGTGVPQAIQDVIRLSRFNFVSQTEPQYWFAASPSEVSRQLNAIVDLGVIDETNEAIGKTLWQCQEAVRVGMVSLKESKAKRDALEWVGVADQQLGAIEELEDCRRLIVEKRGKLQLAVDQVKLTIGKRDGCRALWDAIAVVGRSYVAWQKHAVRQSELAGALTMLAVTLQQRQFASVDIKPLSDAMMRYSEVVARRASLDRLREGVSKSRGIVLTVGIVRDQFQRTVVERIEAYYGVNDIRIRLLGLIQHIKGSKERHEVKYVEYRSLREQLNGEAGGRCPICGNELKGTANAI